eukprot:122868-Prymnesium_polylepis.1
MWQGFERVRRPPYTKATKPTARPQPAPAPPLHAYKPCASSWVKYRLALRPKGVAGLWPVPTRRGTWGRVVTAVTPARGREKSPQPRSPYPDTSSRSKMLRDLQLDGCSINGTRPTYSVGNEVFQLTEASIGVNSINSQRTPPERGFSVKPGIINNHMYD